MDDFQAEIRKAIKKVTNLEDIPLEVPPDPEMGDYAFPTFSLSKEYKKAPNVISQELCKKIPLTANIVKISVIGPYLNFFVNKGTLSEKVITDTIKKGTKYGSSNIGKGEKVVIDFSSPNIAKPFGIGHLRSTVIGNSLYKIHEFLGYKAYGINYIGDWGTQFGKLIVAFKKWGSEEKLEKEAVDHLLELYVKFHNEAEKDEALEELARETFSKLEKGDKELRKIWKHFRELSLKEFKKVYDRLGVKFDSYNGESYYEKYLDETVKLIEKKGITEISDGALVVSLEKFGMPPLLLRKKDGATLYATRDLAAVMNRYKEHKFAKMLYEVGSEQKLHFSQLFKVLELMGLSWYKKCEHVNHGLYKFKEGKMSTRKGNVVFVEDVLDKAVALTLNIIKEKNPGLEGKEQVAEEVGISAMIFNDLSNDRIKDITFDWDKILDFEGESGPYVQYANVRIHSIIEKIEKKKGKKIDYSNLSSPEENALVKMIAKFPETLESAAASNKPHIIARHLLELSQRFNEFYQKNPVSKAEEDIKNARIMLILAVSVVLENGMNLLGMKIPKKM